MVGSGMKPMQYSAVFGLLAGLTGCLLLLQGLFLVCQTLHRMTRSLSVPASSADLVSVPRLGQSMLEAAPDTRLGKLALLFRETLGAEHAGHADLKPTHQWP